jgi:hypothetical protein
LQTRTFCRFGHFCRFMHTSAWIDLGRSLEGGCCSHRANPQTAPPGPRNLRTRREGGKLNVQAAAAIRVPAAVCRDSKAMCGPV